MHVSHHSRETARKPGRLKKAVWGWGRGVLGSLHSGRPSSFLLPNYRDDSSLCQLFLRSLEIERVKGPANFISHGQGRGALVLLAGARLGRRAGGASELD